MREGPWEIFMSAFLIGCRGCLCLWCSLNHAPTFTPNTASLDYKGFRVKGVGFKVKGSGFRLSSNCEARIVFNTSRGLVET